MDDDEEEEESLARMFVKQLQGTKALTFTTWDWPLTKEETRRRLVAYVKHKTAAGEEEQHKLRKKLEAIQQAFKF